MLRLFRRAQEKSLESVIPGLLGPRATPTIARAGKKCGGPGSARRASRDPSSPVKISAEWDGGEPGLGEVSVECFVWADQPERLDQPLVAVAVARANPAEVQQARAGEWLLYRLDDHSSVWSYVPADEQQTIREAIEAHGDEAISSRPLAWLRAEHSYRGSNRLRVSRPCCACGPHWLQLSSVCITSFAQPYPGKNVTPGPG